MFESTNTASLMQLLATQGSAPKSQRSGEQRESASAGRGVAHIVGDELTQLIGEERTHTASSACGNRRRLLEELAIDRDRNVVLGGHKVPASGQYLSSRKIREGLRHVKRAQQSRMRPPSVNARAGTHFMRAKPWGCAHVGIEPLPVQLPEEQRLAHVVHGDGIGAPKISDGARHAQDPAAGARGEVEVLGGELKQVAGFAIGGGVAVEIDHWERAVQDALAVKLERTGAAHPRADQGAGVRHWAGLE